jgi:hypothetical protein
LHSNKVSSSPYLRGTGYYEYSTLSGQVRICQSVMSWSKLISCSFHSTVIYLEFAGKGVKTLILATLLVIRHTCNVNHRELHTLLQFIQLTVWKSTASSVSWSQNCGNFNGIQHVTFIINTKIYYWVQCLCLFNNEILRKLRIGYIFLFYFDSLLWNVSYKKQTIQIIAIVLKNNFIRIFRFNYRAVGTVLL